MDIIDQLINEAQVELDKIANDKNGAPENPNSTSNPAGNDIITTANSFLQSIEEFKQSLAAVTGGANPDQQTEANPQMVDENNVPAQAIPTETGGGATIQTPGGAVIKLASMFKIASCLGSDAFKEVK